MRQKIAFLFLFCCVFIIAAEGYIPRCCSETAKTIPMRVLQKVKSHQFSSGNCDIDAIILFVRWRKLCANPEDNNVKKWLKTLRDEKKPKRVKSAGRARRKGRRGGKTKSPNN